MICAYVVARTASEALARVLQGIYHLTYQEAVENQWDSKDKIYTFRFNFVVE